jgi:Icc-related predicted phosphoesterase
MLKDWEKYDVSRYVDPGCVPPEEGSFSVHVNKKMLAYETIQKDIETLIEDADLSRSIFLFHTPPYKSNLDRAALDGKFYDHVPLDVHLGSIAVERFIKERQPMITLHGHIHESTSLTGEWKDTIGATICMNAAHNGRELALIRFDPDHPEKAARSLI